MTQTTTTTRTPNTRTNTDTNNCGQVVPFDCINECGAYLCNWSGHLMRVPGDALAAGRSPVIAMCGPDQLFVTKISNDPFVPVTKARLTASNFDCPVNF